MSGPKPGRPREFRRDLGEGWADVVSTAHRDALIHLEGPHGIRATVPQEHAEEAFDVLRIPVKFRHTRGRPPRIVPGHLVLAILRVHKAGGRVTQGRVRGELDDILCEQHGSDAVIDETPVSIREVQRLAAVLHDTLRLDPEVPWPEFVSYVISGWEQPVFVTVPRPAEPPPL